MFLLKTCEVCGEAENVCQLWAMKIASFVGFDTLTEWKVKPNDVALPISVWLLWCHLHVV